MGSINIIFILAAIQSNRGAHAYSPVVCFVLFFFSFLFLILFLDFGFTSLDVREHIVQFQLNVDSPFGFF